MTALLLDLLNSLGQRAVIGEQRRSRNLDFGHSCMKWITLLLHFSHPRSEQLVLEGHPLDLLFEFSVSGEVQSILEMTVSQLALKRLDSSLV
jgi:hypothetical protein